MRHKFDKLNLFIDTGNTYENGKWLLFNDENILIFVQTVVSVD